MTVPVTLLQTKLSFLLFQFDCLPNFASRKSADRLIVVVTSTTNDSIRLTSKFFKANTLWFCKRYLKFFLQLPTVKSTRIQPLTTKITFWDFQSFFCQNFYVDWAGMRALTFRTSRSVSVCSAVNQGKGISIRAQIITFTHLSPRTKAFFHPSSPPSRWKRNYPMRGMSADEMSAKHFSGGAEWNFPK